MKSLVAPVKPKKITIFDTKALVAFNEYGEPIQGFTSWQDAMKYINKELGYKSAEDSVKVNISAHIKKNKGTAFKLRWQFVDKELVSGPSEAEVKTARREELKEKRAVKKAAAIEEREAQQAATAIEFQQRFEENKASVEDGDWRDRGARIYTTQHFALAFKNRLGRFLWPVDRELMEEAIYDFQVNGGTIYSDGSIYKPAHVPVIIDRKEWLICVSYNEVKRNYVGITILERRR